MNWVTIDLRGCTVYLDDVIVYSDTWESNLSCIRELFTCLAQARLTVNLAKCEFALATMTYLGHVVGQGQGQGCPMDPAVWAVEQFPVLTTKKS